MSRSSTNLASIVPRPQPGDDVQAFIDRSGLQFLVAQAARLAAEHLPLVTGPTYAKIQDPDSGAEWIEITARVRDTGPAIREAHRRFTRAWLSAAPPERSLDVRLAISFV
ncbi:MAG TPA: hypothetical protein VGI81_28890 [Tepidisphaeraceae bacterium]|jgi:hypothetical protein